MNILNTFRKNPTFFLSSFVIAVMVLGMVLATLASRYSQDNRNKAVNPNGTIKVVLNPGTRVLVPGQKVTISVDAAIPAATVLEGFQIGLKFTGTIPQDLSFEPVVSPELNVINQGIQTVGSGKQLQFLMYTSDPTKPVTTTVVTQKSLGKLSFTVPNSGSMGTAFDSSFSKIIQHTTGTDLLIPPLSYTYTFTTAATPTATPRPSAPATPSPTPRIFYSPVVTVISPNGGEVLKIGQSSVPLRWNVDLGSWNGVGTLKTSLILRKVGSTNPVLTIADAANTTVGSNTYTWTIPNLTVGSYTLEALVTLTYPNGDKAAGSDVSNNLFNIVSATASPTPTPKVTVRPTATPTPRPSTPSPTPYPTSLPSGVARSIDIRVKIAGINDDKGAVKVRLLSAPAGYTQALITRDVVLTHEGNGFYIGRVDSPNGPFPSVGWIAIKGEKHSQRVFNNINLTTDNQLIDLTGKPLQPGDLPNQDGVIDTKDVNVMLAIFAKGDQTAADIKTADLNYDGVVNAADLGLMLTTLSTKVDEGF